MSSHCMRRDPVIVPFYHSGMARIMPEHGRIPRVGQTVAVTVGEPIDVSDLTCQCHEAGNTQVRSNALICSKIMAAGVPHTASNAKRFPIAQTLHWADLAKRAGRQGRVLS